MHGVIICPFSSCSESYLKLQNISVSLDEAEIKCEATNVVEKNPVTTPSLVNLIVFGRSFNHTIYYVHNINGLIYCKHATSTHSNYNVQKSFPSDEELYIRASA